MAAAPTLDKPAAPTAGKITHHSVELCWEATLDKANEKRQAHTSGSADSRLQVQAEQKDKHGSWNSIYTGYAKQFTAENLEAWETYVFRIRFVDGTTNTTSDWSPEFTTTTLKKPMCGDDIHSAISHQSISELERVLETKEANVDAYDKYGFSPLMQAAQKGYTEMIEILVENGANVNLQNEAGKTALMLASFAGKFDAVKELCYHGADKQLSDKGGSTALHSAMDCGQNELTEWLLENGADINATDVNGWTPLLRISAVTGNKDMASLLLRAGADVNVRDKDGKTPLMIAVVNGHQPLVEVLLEGNADLTIKNDFGKTAYDMAVSMDKVRLIKTFEAFMEKKGIKVR